MDMKVTFSIITISTTLAIFFGTVITAPDNVWAAPQVKVDSASCSEDQKNINVKFSWSGFSPDDTLGLSVEGDHTLPLITKMYDGTSDGSGSGEFSLSLPTSSKLTLVLNAAGSGGGAMAFFSPSCGVSEEHKK
jgi:hypothetical protein